MKLRVGRKVGRTLYLQVGEEPSDGDVLVGIVDTSALASLIADSVNDRGEVGPLVYAQLLRSEEQ